MSLIHRRSFLAAASAALLPGLARAHSPWGQYAVYRQKHLLVLSTRDDAESYPYSKRLVEAINQTAPEASARPARARNLRRAYDLLRTDQFQFALLSGANVASMRQGSGPFATDGPVGLSLVYAFADLEFVVRDDVLDNHVAIVTHAVLSSLADLPDAISPDEVRMRPMLHPGALSAIDEFVTHEGGTE